MKTIFAFVICLLCVSSTFAQTAAELTAKYGKPTQVYSVSENIWMTPEYSADGQVCQMRLFPKKTDDHTNYLADKLPFAELVSFLNALVPVGERGNKIPLNFGATATGGPAAWTTYGYERVSFMFISSFPSPGFDNSPPLKKGDYIFPAELAQMDREPRSSAPAADDFLNRQREPADIVMITWNNRKCVSTK